MRGNAGKKKRTNQFSAFPSAFDEGGGGKKSAPTGSSGAQWIKQSLDQAKTKTGSPDLMDLGENR